jgi:hypothetical protein
VRYLLIEPTQILSKPMACKFAEAPEGSSAAWLVQINCQFSLRSGNNLPNAGFQRHGVGAGLCPAKLGLGRRDVTVEKAK